MPDPVLALLAGSVLACLATFGVAAADAGWANAGKVASGATFGCFVTSALLFCGAPGWFAGLLGGGVAALWAVVLGELQSAID